MVNYSNAKIYKLICNITGLIYIGATCSTLCKRLTGHVDNFKRYKNKKYPYTTSFKIIENQDYSIILLEEIKNCKNKEQLNARERYYIENIKCVNKKVEGRTRKEITKSYKDKNKTKINQKCLCICGGKYTVSNKSIHEKTKKHNKYIEINNK